MKSKWAIASLLFAVICATPLMATDVQFYDVDGNLLTDVNIDVMTMNELGERNSESIPADGSGTYSINVEAGQKAQLRPWNSSTEYLPYAKVFPVELEGPIQIVLTMSPQGDQCATAEAVVVPSVTAGSTIGALSDPIVAGAFCGTSINDPSAGAWFSVVGNGNTYRASTCEADGSGSADFDTKITVICPACDADPLWCVDGNDDSAGCGFPSFHSTVEWGTQDGGEYLIFVHGFGFSTGNFNLEVVDTLVAGAPGVDCLPPVPPPPTGSCCSCLAPGFNCTIEEEAACLARTNDPAAYQGDDSTCFTLSATSVVYDGMGGDIPDASLVGLSVDLEVVDSLIIGDINVGLNITHTWVGDLIVELTSPGGDTQTIIDRPGVPASTFGCSEDNYDIVLDEEGTGGAVDTLCNASMVSPPNYTSDGDLTSFYGTNAQGTWNLFILDLASPDPGSLNGWSLEIFEGVQVCPDTSGNTGGTGENDNEAEDDSIYILDTQVGGAGNDGLLELGFNTLGNDDDPQTTNAAREGGAAAKRTGR